MTTDLDSLFSLPKGKFIKIDNITKKLMRSMPTTYFIMGDNMKRKGYGGQAAEMRGEPNTIGIPTKWGPYWSDSAFFSDADWNKELVRNTIVTSFDYIEELLNNGKNIVMSTHGIGTNRARLKQCAPVIWNYISYRIQLLEEKYGEPQNN